VKPRHWTTCRRRSQEPTAEQLAAEELVRWALEQGLSQTGLERFTEAADRTVLEGAACLACHANKSRGRSVVGCRHGDPHPPSIASPPSAGAEGTFASTCACWATVACVSHDNLSRHG
jgi:hypothetical protein